MQVGDRIRTTSFAAADPEGRIVPIGSTAVCDGVGDDGFRTVLFDAPNLKRNGSFPLGIEGVDDPEISSFKLDFELVTD